MDGDEKTTPEPMVKCQQCRGSCLVTTRKLYIWGDDKNRIIPCPKCRGKGWIQVD